MMYLLICEGLLYFRGFEVSDVHSAYLLQPDYITPDKRAVWISLIAPMCFEGKGLHGWGGVDDFADDLAGAGF